MRAALSTLQVQHPLLRGRPLAILGGALTAACVLGLLAGASPLLAGAATVAGLLMLLSLIWPGLATLLVLFVIYTNAAVVAVHFHGAPWIVGASPPLLLAIPLISHLLVHRQRIVIGRALPLILVYLLIQMLGTFFSRDITVSLEELQRFLMEGLGLYFLITNTVRTPEQLRRATWALLLAGACMGALAFYQQVTGSFGNNYLGFAQVSNAMITVGDGGLLGDTRQPRIAGSVGETNRFAQVLLMIVPLGLFRIWGERSLALRGVAGMATILTALGLLTTFSRGAALGFMILVAAMVALREVRLPQLLAVLLGATLVLSLMPQYLDRVAGIEGVIGLVLPDSELEGADPDGSLEVRANLALSAIYVFLDHPAIGVGPGMFPHYYQDYADRSGFRRYYTTKQAHNLYFGVAAETGAAGLLCLLAILGLTLRDLYRNRARWRQVDPGVAHLMTGYLLAVVSYMGTGIGLHFSYIRYFWVMLALAAVAAQLVPPADRSAEAVSEPGSPAGG